MAIHEEPSYIKGQVNPIFRDVNLVKENELPTLNDFQHEHYFEWQDERNVMCKCGKGKTLGEDLTILDGTIIPV